MRIVFFLSILAVALSFALAHPGAGPMAAVKPVGMMKRQPAVKRDANLAEQEAPSLEKREIVFNALELVAAALFDDLPTHRRQSVIGLLTAMLVDEDDQMDEEAASNTLLPASREEMAVAASTSPAAMPTSQIVESGASPTITAKAIKKMSLPERLRRAGERRNMRPAAKAI